MRYVPQTYEETAMAVLSIDVKGIKISLCEHEKITNPKAFIESHLELLKENWGRPFARPYLLRMIELIDKYK